jgi:hypothetical protein
VGTQITIDSTAAGRGWFVDATPQDNSEFGVYVATTELQAAPGSAAYGRMDLLTTVLHEMGNAMGFSEDQGRDVMSDTLQAGVRDLPAGVIQPAGAAAHAAAANFDAQFAVFNPSLSTSGGAASGTNPVAGFGTVQAGTPAIDWNGSFFGSADRRKPAQIDGSSGWLGDFVNHLGQDDMQRNPNAGIKVQIATDADVLPAATIL